MKFEELGVSGAWVIELEPVEDERGFFARSFSRDEFAAHGLEATIEQCSISYNSRRGTLRGMHWQVAPSEEAKLVRCTAGAIYDVVLDVRTDSPTSGKWAAAELSAENRRMVYVPPGCAHGFQTLMHETEVLYQISAPYDPEAARGVRWDDPAFAITWPLAAEELSPADRSYPPWPGKVNREPADHG